MIEKLSSFQNIYNLGPKRGGIKYHIFCKFKIVQLIQKNQGLLPVFQTFFVLMGPLSTVECSKGRQLRSNLDET